MFDPSFLAVHPGWPTLVEGVMLALPTASPSSLPWDDGSRFPTLIGPKCLQTAPSRAPATEINTGTLGKDLCLPCGRQSLRAVLTGAPPPRPGQGQPSSTTLHSDKPSPTSTHLCRISTCCDVQADSRRPSGFSIRGFFVAVSPRADSGSIETGVLIAFRERPRGKWGWITSSARFSADAYIPVVRK